jgi:hypothetical protein
MPCCHPPDQFDSAPAVTTSGSSGISTCTSSGFAGRLFRCLFAICCFGHLSGMIAEVEAAAEIEIEYADWGFDGRAMPRTFNLLTLGVQNLSETPFEGTLRCRRVLSATGSWSGAELLQNVYVGPLAVRIVQFYPYMLDEGEVWEVRWGDGLEDSFLTERPQLTSGARVVLNDPLKNSGIQQGLKGFLDNWFPVSVVATDALRLVVMDHVPRWEETRRDVFRDWLFRGGILHVLKEPGGKFPEVPISELQVEPRPERFGTGRIYWHDRTRAEIDKPYVYDRMYSTSQDLVDVVDEYGSSFDIDPTSTEFIKRDEEFFEAYAEWDSDRLIPTSLKEFLRPNHEWPLIYLLAGVYLLMLFPGGYLLVRSRVDYRYSLLALVVVVAGFSWVFSVMGARGYGETTSTSSVATARQLPDGRWDVEQWNSLFVTSGGDYAVGIAGDFPIFSTAENIERVSGTIENGRDGRFAVDMPPFTYRTFATRTPIALGKFDAGIISTELTDREDQRDDDSETDDGTIDRQKLKTLKSLRAKIDGVLASKVRNGVILYGDSFYPLSLDALQTGSGELVAGPGVRLIERINLSRQFQRFSGGRAKTPDEALDQFAPWLIARDLRLRRRIDAVNFELPSSEVRIYVDADLPDQLTCQNADDPEASFGNDNGRIIYRLDLFIPESPLRQSLE